MRIKALREYKKLQQKELAYELQIPSNTLSQYENEKREPNLEILQKLSDFFNVSTDYLIGKSNFTTCPICGFSDDPLWEPTRKEHEQFHKKYLKVKEKYPFFMNYGKASALRENSIYAFRNPQNSMNERLKAFDEYLLSAFSLEISKCNYDIEHLDYEQFCKIEVSTLEPDWIISEEFIDKLSEKYGIDKNFLNGNEQILARVSNNDQLMRIISYTEKLNPEMLDALELQVKAWVENNTKG